MNCDCSGVLRPRRLACGGCFLRRLRLRLLDSLMWLWIAISRYDTLSIVPRLSMPTPTA